MKYLNKTILSSGAYPPPQFTPAQGLTELTDRQADVVVQYNGFVNISEGENGEIIVTPNTDTWEKWKATQPDPSETLATEVRSKRDTLLQESDWTQMIDSPLSEDEKKAWQTYRQALRDIPQQEGFPEQVEWPTPPNT